MAEPITTIGFDADDTLWHNETEYHLTEQDFCAMLGDFADGEHISERLLAAERRNLRLYGYGVKGFTLSMIETAIEVTDGKVAASVIRAIIARGQALLEHPIALLPGVRTALAALKNRYRLVVITKGDLFDQERKIAQSGLGEHFDAVEIVSDKTSTVYQRLFMRHGDGAERAVMIGNSLKSDILPAIEAGAHGVHVPYAVTWAMEHAEAPADHPRFHRLDNLEEAPALLDRIRAAVEKS
jgi:putative hydrolase of the HAD superfamily